VRQQRSKLFEIRHTGLTPEIPNGDTRVVVELRDQLIKLKYSPAPEVTAVVHGQP